MGKLAGLDLPYNYVPSNPANYGGTRALSNIEYIVVHYTANDGDTDTGNGSYFGRTKVGAGAHMFVDEDSCTQSILFNRVAYHCETAGMKFKCACRNYNSIGVEMCSDKQGGKYIITRQTMLNTVKVVKYLMREYNVPADRVIRHYDVCGKLCPEPWVRVASEWTEFKRLITEAEKKEDEEMVETINITVNGKEIKADAIVKDGRTFLSLRALENAGFVVGYYANTKRRTLGNIFKELPVVVGEKKEFVNAINIEGRNYVGIRDMAEMLGVGVEYDRATDTVTLKK